MSRRSDRVLHLFSLLISVREAGIPRVGLREFMQRIEAASCTPPLQVLLHPRLTGFGSGSIAEMASLAALVALLKPRRLLEFGTCDGASTWHLWANASPDAQITTLDLPAKARVTGSSDPGLQGIDARPFLPIGPRVRLVETDSRQWSPDVENIDFCFIDAGHSYQCVRNDTEKALSVMRPGGLVMWHDASWGRDGYGVNTYLKELRAAGSDIVLLDAGQYDYCALAALVV